MDAARVRGILLHGLLAPLVTLGSVLVVAAIAGVDLGITVLVVSMAGAGGLVAVLLADTRSMQPDTNGNDLNAPDARNPVSVRSELTDSPSVSGGNKRVVTRYTTGLFLSAALLVLYLGGAFGV